VADTGALAANNRSHRKLGLIEKPLRADQAFTSAFLDSANATK